MDEVPIALGRPGSLRARRASVASHIFTRGDDVVNVLEDVEDASSATVAKTDPSNEQSAALGSVRDVKLPHMLQLHGTDR